MKYLLPILSMMFLCLTPVQAAETGLVVRQARVYASADSTAVTVAEIRAGTKVSIFSREGGWKEIFSEEQAVIGWVRGYQVREGNISTAPEVKTEADSRGFLSGLASFSRRASSFFKSGNASTSSGTATIGVRGLSEAEIVSAVADFAELEKMKQFASNQQRMPAFKQQGKLTPQNIAHLPGP